MAPKSKEDPLTHSTLYFDWLSQSKIRANFDSRNISALRT